MMLKLCYVLFCQNHCQEHRHRGPSSPDPIIHHIDRPLIRVGQYLKYLFLLNLSSWNIAILVWFAVPLQRFYRFKRHFNLLLFNNNNNKKYLKYVVEILLVFSIWCLKYWPLSILCFSILNTFLLLKVFWKYCIENTFSKDFYYLIRWLEPETIQTNNVM